MTVKCFLFVSSFCFFFWLSSSTFNLILFVLDRPSDRRDGDGSGDRGRSESQRKEERRHRSLCTGTFYLLCISAYLLFVCLSVCFSVCLSVNSLCQKRKKKDAIVQCALVCKFLFVFLSVSLNFCLFIIKFFLFFFNFKCFSLYGLSLVFLDIRS